MKEQKKGISLIVLVITIIVMIILASAVVITLSNTNIITKAKEAVEKTNAANNMYLSEIKLAERTLEKTQGASKVKDKEGGVLRVENEGTKDEIYYIESIDDLIAFSTSVNEGNTYEGKIVKLTQLLDFNSDKSYVDVSLKETVTKGAGFTPIGTLDNPFKGTFDGDGTEIRNLYINTNNENMALFGSIDDATIKNVGVTGSVVGDGVAAGIVTNACTTNKTTYIQNCYNKARIHASSNVEAYVGGVVSFAWGSEEKKVIIEDCYNEGEISCESGAAIGGVVAFNVYSEINRCYNIGKIYSNNIINTGGLVGLISDGEVYNSYNTGDIIVENSVYVGGVAGEIAATKIYNVYNAGNINIKGYSDEIAGIVCQASNEGNKIGNGFNIGELIAVGVGNPGIYECIFACYEEEIDKLYYVSRGYEPASDANGSFIQKTLSEMNSQAFVDELNENIKDMPECVKWKLGTNGYPVLDM